MAIIEELIVYYKWTSLVNITKREKGKAFGGKKWG